MFTATSVQVTTAAREPAHPPNIALAALVPWWPARTHSTHCCPTAAERRQSGHAGRPQRTHDTYVSRPGCLKQVGGTGVSAGPPSVPAGPGPGVLMSLSSLVRRLCDLDRLQDHVVDGTVVPAGPHPADRIDHVGALDHLTEDGVPAVEVRGGNGGDEELRAVRARPGVGHGQQVRPVEGEIRVE